MPQELLRFNWVDAVVVILLIRTIYIGTKAGLSTEIFRSAGVLAGLYFAITYYQTIGSWISSKVSLQPEIAEAGSFLVLVLMCMLILKLIDWGLSKIVKVAFSERLANWGGFILGSLRGAILLSLMLMFFGITQIDYLVKSVDENSFTGRYVKQVGPSVYKLITMNFYSPLGKVEN